MMAWERQRRLQDKYNYLQDMEKMKNFDFEEWRKRFMKWTNNKKSRIMDLFRKMDKDNKNKVLREDFIQGIIKSKFPTSNIEMQAVADIFDANKDGYVDRDEYIRALRPDWGEPKTDAEKIRDAVEDAVSACTCRQRFKVHQVGEGKYRFGESQKLRLVRILRSTVMVRVGGGWVQLDEFLVKNDPCRAKGRTNIELREQFILADGVSQSMTPFKNKGSTDSGSTTERRPSSLSAAGPITKVKEKTMRSTPMGRASFSADSSISDETTPSYGMRKGSAPVTRMTPGSRSSSREPGSRPSSRPPSRAGSDISLDSNDGVGMRRQSSFTRPNSRPSQGGLYSGRSSTPSKGGVANKKMSAPTITRTPAAKTNGAVRGRVRNSSGSSTESPLTRDRLSVTSPGGASPNLSSSRLLRKGSGASDTPRGTARKYGASGTSSLGRTKKPSSGAT